SGRDADPGARNHSQRHLYRKAVHAARAARRDARRPEKIERVSAAPAGRMPGMGVLQLWARQPQRVWLRRALFQIHLWTGIGVGLYVLMISVTGSILVYRVELVRNLAPQPDAAAAAKGTPLSEAQLTEAAKR